MLPKAELKGLECKIILKRELPKKIFIDFRRLMQVVYNITDNSIKYTFKGTIRIRINYTKKSELSIKIQDTGIGISSKDLSKINKLFGLLDKKFSKNETGIGMGLTVSKTIINFMNGSFAISSEIDIGTICKIKIPITFNHKPKVF